MEGKRPASHPPFARAGCPRCGGTSASPFTAAGVCLRCAGTRVLEFETAISTTDSSDAAGGAAAADLPERIGAFEIIEELGRGGMGRVFAARQIGLGRIVALKALAAGRNTADLELRFLREAQTAARLRHPHIVAVHDSGRAHGFVYFAMDYIEGGDLARRARAQPLAPRAIAGLLHKIAGALAYTHGEGVLHRDLKPSNILLDGDEPRLADFGLAAQLEAGGDLTSATSVLGTPHYLAPEALRGGSAALTVASDIYALGVILFELLTGRTPFAGTSPAELAAIIERSEPPAPRTLAPATPRDLETICLKCLEREATRRYASAAALAEDLRRFLADEPILARPPGAWERFRKFSRRHQAGVAAAGVVAATLVAATAVSATLAVRARRAEKHAAAEAAAATALAGFLQKDLLAQASPNEQPDREVKLRTVLERAAAKIDERFPAQPLVAADLHAVIGQVFESLGEYESARRHFEQELALRERHLGAEDPRTLAAMHGLAGVHHSHGRLAEAEKLAARTLAGREGVLGPEHPATLETATMRGVALRDLGRTAEAEAALNGIIATIRRARGPGDASLVLPLRSLAAIRYAQMRLAEAESLVREALGIQTGVAGEENPATLVVLSDLAVMLQRAGKVDEAGAITERVLALRRRVLGPEHPHTLTSMGNLASFYKSRDRLDEAERLQLATLEIMRPALGPDHHRVLQTTRNLADTYRLQGKLQAAADLLGENLAACRRTHGDTHPNTVAALGALGDVLIALGDAARAEPLLREALAAYEKEGAPRWRLAAVRSQLGHALAQQRRFEEAEPLLVGGLEDFRRGEKDVPPSFRKFISNMGDHVIELYVAWGKPERAAEWKARLGKK